jgi:hypothetical protein
MTLKSTSPETATITRPQQLPRPPASKKFPA